MIVGTQNIRYGKTYYFHTIIILLFKSAHFSTSIFIVDLKYSELEFNVVTFYGHLAVVVDLVNDFRLF